MHGFLLVLTGAGLLACSVSAGTLPSASPSPSSLPMVTVAPSPVPVSPAEAKSLLKEYTRTLQNQLKAMEHRQKFEVNELKASQSARQKEWELKERDARHKYFAEHPKGPDRRAYVQDFLERRKAFLQILSDERIQRVREQQVRLQSAKEDSDIRLREFQEYLKRGEQPPSRLWPVGQ